MSLLFGEKRRKMKGGPDATISQVAESPLPERLP